MTRNILIICCFICCLTCACESRQEKARKLLQEGSQSLYRGDYQKAIELLTRSIRYKPDMPEAYFLRGGAHFSLKEVQLAMDDYTKAIEINPVYADAWATRGDIYFYLGDKTKACENYREAQRLGKPNMNDKTRNCP